MIAWSYMEYEELVLKNLLLAQQKRRKNAVIINSTKQITILNKVKKIVNDVMSKNEPSKKREVER